MSVLERYILEPNCPSFLRDDVMGIQRKAIVTGELRPGPRVKEATIARQMDISRGPVREALVALEREGLVSLNPHRSPTVAAFDCQDLRDLVEVRYLIETHAVRLLNGQLTVADLDRLEELQAAMSTSKEKGDRAAAVEADLGLHQEIVRLAGNKWLYRMWTLLAAHTRLFLTLAIEVGFELQQMVGSHAELLDALRKGDTRLAADTIHRHNREASDAIALAIKRR